MQWVYNATHDDVTAAALQYSIIVCPRPQEQCVYHAARVGERGEGMRGGGGSHRVSYVLNTLQPDTMYEVYVCAVSDNDDNIGASDRLVFQTLPGWYAFEVDNT